MSARKDDAGKPPISLLPRSALMAAARVMAKGRVRYGADNWRSGAGMDWRRLIDAAMRHLLAFSDGEDFDDGEGGSGELHLANAICCLSFLIEYYEKGIGHDDRFKLAGPETAQNTTALAEAVAREVETYYEVVATGGTGSDYVIGTLGTREGAQLFVELVKSDWPTFKLLIREVSSDAGHQETA